MKLLEYESKRIFRDNGIIIPQSEVIDSPNKAKEVQSRIGGNVVLKAQVSVGGRGKSGGVLFANSDDVDSVAIELFNKTIKGLPVKQVLVEQALDILQEYYVSISIDRTNKTPIILFSESGGCDIEEIAKNNSTSIRREYISPLFQEIPSFILRNLLEGIDNKKLIAPVINNLYKIFCKYDAILVEINPLVLTRDGSIIAADGKIIIDDNALYRQGIKENRDLTAREAEAEQYGFSYVELNGNIGVIGNGAGLTMATLDIISHYRGKAANFLDVGGGADYERVVRAIRLVASIPNIKVIVVNLLGGITKCDDVAKGIIESAVSIPVIVRLAGTNESEGRAILKNKGIQMYDTMDQAIKSAVEVANK
ncbi:MAG TPA: ADP-forming succinate--CoA ligase subunit beta [Methanocorpusculum sp.]|nr:ADP-forming succinate--CoA ligase subunit beta [Methanocorpusculum sp.]